MYGVILEGVQVTQKTWGDVMVRACKYLLLSANMNIYKPRLFHQAAISLHLYLYLYIYSVSPYFFPFLRSYVSSRNSSTDDMMKPISDLGAQRDFAWNTVMWASGNSKFKISEKFSSYGSGKFQIFPEATADRIFYDTEIQSAGWSNSDGVCFNHTSRGFFDIPTKSIVIQTNLCPEGFCKDNQVRR